MSARRTIDPGLLRHRLLLQAPTAEPDGMGGFETGWADVATVDALIAPPSARARFAADRETADVTHTVTIRHRAGVVPGMRFAMDGRHLVIRTVRDLDETGRYLVCGTVETTP